MSTAVRDWVSEQYRRLTSAQRRALYAIAIVYGVWIPAAIDVVGVTRTRQGVDLRAIWFVFVAAITFALGLLALSIPAPSTSQSTHTRPLGALDYAALPFGVFCIYLVGYYPALMTDDSYYQWDQVVSGRFDATLPVAHTLLYWLASRAWMSPAAPAVAQSAALALAFGASMVLLLRAGAPARLLWGLTAFFALLPLNGAMAVSLWKDIAFSTAILWLTLIVFRIVLSEGSVLGERRTVFELGLAIALVALLRPNGPAAAIATATAIVLSYRKFWRSSLAAAAGALLMVLFVNVGVTYAAGVSYEGVGVYRASPFIYDIGAVLNADAKIDIRVDSHKRQVAVVRLQSQRVTRAEQVVLSQFEDVHEWAFMYTSGGYPYWHTTRDHWNRLDEPGKRDQLMRVWRAIAIRNPGIVLRHRIEAARIGWLIDADGFRAAIYADKALPERLKQPVDPPVPLLTRALDLLLSKTVLMRRIKAFTGHPALATYVTLFCFIVTALRRKSLDVLLIAVPFVANWAATMAFCMAPDARYFYAAFVVLPFAFGLLWTRPGAPPSSQPMDG